MARISKVRLAGGAILLLAVIFVGGCTSSMKARSAFEDAEQYAAAENFDQAVVKYLEASELEPSRKSYKLKLMSSRTRAAAAHIKKARDLTKESKYVEALSEYRQARELSSSLEVAVQEEAKLRNLLDAAKFAEEGAVFYGKRNFLPARKIITKSLELDPLNTRALAIKHLLDDQQHAVSMDGVELDVASSEPITLSFKDANIKEVFGVLTQLSGINFIFDEDIRSQSISVLLEKASFAQAMELILQMNGLEKKVLNSKTMIIFPQSREKEKQYGDQVIQIFYLSHIDSKKAVNLLRTMLQLRKVYVHEERNALVVRDKPEVIKLAEQILNAADRENSEVILALELVSVSDTDALDVGVKLSKYGTGVGFSKDVESGGDPTLLAQALPAAGESLSNLAQTLNGLQTFYTVPSAEFNLAKTLTSTEILANPKIRVRNREKAKVHVGTREPVITTTTTNSTSTTNIQYVDVGIKLDVEPVIQLNNTVETKLKLEVSQVTDRIEVGPAEAKTTALTISTTNAETVLTLQDGVQTIIGGLFEQSDVKQRDTIPFLGDIPILGALFTNFSDDDSKREILLSITPYIVKQIEVPDADVATIWSGGEDNLKNGPNFRAFAQPLISEIEAVRPLSVPSIKPLMLDKNYTNEEFRSSEEKVPDTIEEVKESPQIEEVPNSETLRPEVVLPEENVIPEMPLVQEAVIQTEVLPEQKEVGAPIVLEMPKKGPVTLLFETPENVEKDQEFTVSVSIQDVDNLYSAPLFVKYDPAVLELINLSEGSFLKQEGQSTVFSSSPNRTTGQVIVGYKQGTGGKGATGSGKLFDLNFKALTEGETSLEVNRINFRNPEGVRLKVSSEPVMIEVR